MTPQQLLYGIVKARNSEGVKAVLNDHADDLGLDDYLQLPNDFFGGRQANSDSIHAMSYVGNAGYEKITNMHDAVIALLQQQRWFQSDPQNATQALHEIASRQKEGVPGVYVTTANATPQNGQDGRHRPETNVSFIDEGIGITPERMPSTILSLGGSNKLRNPLMAGCYGQGGSAIHGFTDFSLVLSRSYEDPSVIGFTVVYEVFPEDARTPTYVYLTDYDGKVMSLKVSSLDSTQFVHPSSLDGKDADEGIIPIIADKLILPDHGTVVKVWNLKNSPFETGNSAYNFLRDRGFALEAPTRLRIGVETQNEEDREGGQRRRQNVRGMRNVLSGIGPRLGGRNTYTNLAHQVGVGEAFDGEADIHCWIRDYSDDAKAKHEERVATALKERRPAPRRAPLIENITGIKKRVKKPIYVTLNGMSHFNLHSQILLRKAGLEYLPAHMIMEIDCDRLDSRKKGRVFVSSREGIKQDPLESLREDILRWLKNEASDPDSELSRANEKLRIESDRQTNSEANDPETTEAFISIMSSSVVGSIRSSYGSPGPRIASVDGRNAGKSGENPGEDGRDEKVRVPAKRATMTIQNIPTTIEVNKATIQAGETEHVKVRIDGPDDWNDAISIDLPPFLTQRNKPTLENGRISYLVHADAPVGEKGEITVTVDRSRVNMDPLVGTCTVEVVRRVASEPTGSGKEQRTRNGIPDIRIVETSPSASNWDQLSTGETEDALLAMTYKSHASGITVLWNTDFAPVCKAMTHTEKNFGAAGRVKLIRDIYNFIRMLALTHLDTGSDEVTEADKIAWGQAITATAAITAATMTKEKIRGIAVDEEAAEEIAEAA